MKRNKIKSKFTTSSHIIKAMMLNFQENMRHKQPQLIFIPVISDECCSSIKHHPVFCL